MSDESIAPDPSATPAEPSDGGPSDGGPSSGAPTSGEANSRAASAVEPETPAPILVSEPSDGIPEVIDTPAGLAAAAARLGNGMGPLAVDAERASGFRYSSRAYLIQLRRAGAGTVIIDPIPIADAFGPLTTAINPLEWILHAADQDLPCLAELGLLPAKIYDTELAGRLAGFERVGLAAIVERTLGKELRKGHGAADWSTRPLPEPWLVYAALDVELLADLQAAMVAELDGQGKSEWAAQEFEYVRTKTVPEPSPERWRRLSGIHRLRQPSQLAVARELWLVRDELAYERDIAPGRILPAAAIIDAAITQPHTLAGLRGLAVFGGPRQRRQSRLWLDAIDTALANERDFPRLTRGGDGPPAVNRWARSNPDAAARLSAVRPHLLALSERVHVPVENLLQPDIVRSLCWDGSGPADDRYADTTETIDAYLSARHARPWQRELTVPVIAAALAG